MSLRTVAPVVVAASIMLACPSAEGFRSLPPGEAKQRRSTAGFEARPRPTVAELPGAASAGPLAARGRWLIDPLGRVVVIHGLFGVWKVPGLLPPDSPSDPAGFTTQDADRVASLGLNGFRLAWYWQGLQPTAGSFAAGYLERLAELVAELGARGVFVLLDDHQDMYNERFGGLGFPDWTVYDDGLPNQPSTGFPGNYFLMPALWRAFDSLWEDRAGLWRSFGQAAAHVAARFASDPMVLGYDLMNEPWPGSSWPSCAQPLGCPLFDATLQRAEDAFALAVRAADRRHLVFLEPNFFFDAGVVSWLSTPPAAVRPVGLSFHDLCALRGALQVGQSTSLAGSGPQGDQAIDAACAPTDAQVLRNAQATARRIGGPALLTEVTPADSGDVAGLECLLERADRMMIGWTASGISWRTGEFRELDPAKAAVLARAYPRAVAGTPLAYGFDPRTGVFVLRYRPARRVDAPTMIFLPVQIHYPLGYRVSVTGAVITSAPGATLLTLRNLPRSRIVEVRVTPHAGTVQPTAGLPTCPPDAPGVGLPAS